jgi:hypothetical protein
MQRPLGPEGLYCPFWRKAMSKVCHTCPQWVQLRGTNPQTGKEVDSWQCAAASLPMLLLENAKQTRQGAAATESFRNEVVRRSDMQRLPPEIQPAMIEVKQ